MSEAARRETPDDPLALAGAERRVLDRLAHDVPAPATRSRTTVLAIAGALYATFFIFRLVVNDPPALIANFYTIPIAYLAVELGLRAALWGALFAEFLVFLWDLVQTIHLGLLGYVSRAAVFVVVAIVVGRYADGQRQDIAARRRAQRDLALYADELEHLNAALADGLRRLEAFAQIARSVGGETDLSRVLDLILTRGREVLGGRELIACLVEGDELVARAATPGAATAVGRHVPLTGSLVTRALAAPATLAVLDEEESQPLLPGTRAAVLAPLRFRGQPLGVVIVPGAAAADEDLVLAVAASAATALATARSVAADRLRLSIEAAEQARGRWARELHDETLQGLGGAAMMLSTAVSAEDPAVVRRAAEAAYTRVADEVRGLRELIAELRPAALDDLGLGPALETLAERQAAAGGFDAATDLDLPRRLPPELESAVYRIVQEALTNVAKHARAAHVQLHVAAANGSVDVTVEDDGTGFDPAAATEGFGVLGMRERAGLAGGALNVESGPGGPTRLRAHLPIPGAVGRAPTAPEDGSPVMP